MKFLNFLPFYTVAIGSVAGLRNDTTPKHVGRDVACAARNGPYGPDSWPKGYFGKRCTEKRGHYCWRKEVNELADDQECKEISVIFASGTRTSNNFGPDIGGLFVDEMGLKIGFDKFAVQGVHYGKHWPHGSDLYTPKILGGAMELVRHLDRTVSRCPDTKIVLAGHMDGAKVIHAAGYYLTTELGDRVDAGKSVLCQFRF